jgi:hypothetical protein
MNQASGVDRGLVHQEAEAAAPQRLRENTRRVAALEHDVESGAEGGAVRHRISPGHRSPFLP